MWREHAGVCIGCLRFNGYSVLSRDGKVPGCESLVKLIDRSGGWVLYRAPPCRTSLFRSLRFRSLLPGSQARCSCGFGLRSRFFAVGVSLVASVAVRARLLLSYAASGDAPPVRWPLPLCIALHRMVRCIQFDGWI